MPLFFYTLTFIKSNKRVTNTIDPREAELAAKMLIDGIAENLRNGFIVLASLR